MHTKLLRVHIKYISITLDRRYAGSNINVVQDPVERLEDGSRLSILIAVTGDNDACERVLFEYLLDKVLFSAYISTSKPTTK
jgi:hypothetical protein